MASSALKLSSILCLLFYCWSCQDPVKESAAMNFTKQANTDNEEITAVKTLVLSPRAFQKEIISQGKIEAKYASEVTFDLQEQIEEIFVETGQRVKKGALLARLSNFEWANQLKKIDHQIEQAKVNLEAKLIALGYSLEDTLRIPPTILKTARLESNLDGLKIERSLIHYKLGKTKVYAPISGIVGEVEAQAGNHSSAYKKLCTIINDQQLETVFPILEQELPLVRKGQKVKVKPLYRQEQSYESIISAYMPQVDQHGMIKVYAKIVKPAGQLLDGMHVTVYVEDQVSHQLVVPKTAVVDRQNRQVVFVHKDGQALWNYVQIGLENSGFYTITEGLKAGDEVIVSNNFHLVHLERVVVEN